MLQLLTIDDAIKFLKKEERKDNYPYAPDILKFSDSKSKIKAQNILHIHTTTYMNNLSAYVRR